MEPTFAQLGIPFPLFDAQISTSVGYLGRRTCAICNAQKAHCFTVNHVIVRCKCCGRESDIDVYWAQTKTCSGCQGTIGFSSGGRTAIECCYACLRAGKAALTHDTVLGMVSWEQAVEGLTHGVPGLENADFELVASTDEPEWRRARVESELLLELVRTPTYSTWQGDWWQFCCKRPMVFVGIWKERDFDRHAPNGIGQQFLKNLGLFPDDQDLWGHLSDIGGPYMFRCEKCHRFRGHWDND